MYMYSAVTTMGLTWLILIRPNNYTSTSNAACWLFSMSVFVFMPMILMEVSRYRRELARRRRENSARMHRQMESKGYQRKASSVQRSVHYAGEDEIAFTGAYNRRRFTQVHAA